MHDVVVLEAAHDMRNGVALTDVGKELVAEAFAFTGAGNKPCDIHELHHRGHDALGLNNVGQSL